MSRLISVKQAQRLLGKKSAGAVYDMVAKGVFPPGPVVKLGRRIFFNQERLLEFIEAGGSLSTAKNGEAQTQDSVRAA